MTKRITSDMRHNENCFNYLMQLKPFVTKNLVEAMPGLIGLYLLETKYSKRVPYGDLYSYTQNYLEGQIDTIYPKLNKAQTKTLDNLIYAIYHNNNHILEQNAWMTQLNSKTRPLKSNIAKRIAKSLEDNETSVNEITPKKAESLKQRFNTLFTRNFKPQLDTNIPSLINHAYKADSDPSEYRFSTQGQRHLGKVRVSPLFKRWLAINAARCAPDKAVNHIYYNNLGVDRSSLDIPGSNEKALSKALHELEDDPSLKIAVITLPASKSLMSDHYYTHINDKLSYSRVFNELLDIAEGKPHSSGVTDFIISPKIRTLLFGNDEAQTVQMKILLTRSFEAMGMKPKTHLSTAQKQAVWLHFIKFELTDYIQKTLQPASYNFTCKDAIDRGTLSSIYYNLCKSFALNRPMDRAEFENGVDVAAANVKGRGMNFHRLILWNAIDTLVNGQYDHLIIDKKKSWLIYWRDMNCPHERVNQLLKIRISQYEDQLNELSKDKNNIKESGLKLLSSIKHQYKHQVHGQRLLLEVISRSSQLLSSPASPIEMTAYKNLAEELQQKHHPFLLILGGLMKIFLGAIILNRTLIDHGLSSLKTGFFASERKELCQNILNLSSEHDSEHDKGTLLEV